ncbi:MAG: hypothetical protein KatS3mg102_2654 [Planctomycetota bacterium]|nr:MAG: hypothetical protein KatS3mg102_2654 [Planctomycetota bacterium]
MLNALEWAALGAEGPMRQDLRAAARQGGQVCRAAAALLWLGARALAPQHVAAAVWALRRWRARQTLRVPAPEVRGGAGRC